MHWYTSPAHTLNTCFIVEVHCDCLHPCVVCVARIVHITCIDLVWKYGKSDSRMTFE